MKIILPYEIERKIWHWVHKADFEVSGFGKVLWDSDLQGFIVQSVCLLKQEGGAAHTDIDPEALSKAQFELRSEPGQLGFWWHSHVNMAVFMSPQDKETLNEMGRNGWCVAVVYNKKGERKTAISYIYETAFAPEERRLAYQEDIGIIYSQPSLQEVAGWDQQFEDKVTRKDYGYSPTIVGGERKNGIEVDGVKGKQEGLYGLGLETEAKIMGMTIWEYRNHMRNCEFAELDLVDSKMRTYILDKYGHEKKAECSPRNSL